MGNLRTKWLWLLVVLVVVSSFLMTSALGQCSMCRASLSGSNSAFIRNFNIGVLMLLVPPVTIFCSIFLALRRSRVGDKEEIDERSGDA